MYVYFFHNLQAFKLSPIFSLFLLYFFPLTLFLFIYTHAVLGYLSAYKTDAVSAEHNVYMHTNYMYVCM